jgi:hypothetical protein
MRKKSGNMGNERYEQQIFALATEITFGGYGGGV